MKRVFVDTLYWVAVVRPGDPWRPAAIGARRRLGQVQLVTTDEVLSEFLTALSTHKSFRSRAARMVREVLADPSLIVVPQSRESFLHGLALYEDRPDKEYSLADCVSMQVMRSLGITDVLTKDHHFTQEGFTVLITKQS